MRDRRPWELARSLLELQDLLIEEPGLFEERTPPLDTPWSDVPLAFLDVETTGLHADRGDRIVEIAILRRAPGRGEDRYVEIFDPERPIPEAVRKIHAIRDSQVNRARKFEAAIPPIMDLLSGAVWVGHNLAFDIRFVRMEMMRTGRRLPPGWILDTHALSRRILTLPRCTLAAVADHLGHGGRNLHQALDDILTTREVLDSLVMRLEPRPERLADVLEAMVSRPPQGG